MGKVDSLALYKSVMGEDWAEEAVRARSMRDTYAERNKWQAGKGYGAPAKPTAKNILRVASGSRAAVFKRIRNGGCKNVRSLQNQLDYINDKAEVVYSNSVSMRGAEILSEGQKSDIIDQWSDGWNGSSKLGFTSHMLLSFPQDTSFENVRDISMDWCEELFESGQYGDDWDYVVAIHTDRAHPHAHIVLNNRGNTCGEWFSCWRDGVFSPLLMRETQAEIAGKYGVLLDTTTRLERGIFEKPAALDEIYAAKAEGREIQEVALTPQERSVAQAAVIGFSKDYKSVADLLKTKDHKVLSRVVELAAKDLAKLYPVKEGYSMQALREGVESQFDQEPNAFTPFTSVVLAEAQSPQELAYALIDLQEEAEAGRLAEDTVQLMQEHIPSILEEKWPELDRALLSQRTIEPDLEHLNPLDLPTDDDVQNARHSLSEFAASMGVLERLALRDFQKSLNADDISTVGDAIATAERVVANGMEFVEAHTGADRVQAELTAEKHFHNFAHLIPDPEFRLAYSNDGAERFPPSSDLVKDNPDVFQKILKEPEIEAHLDKLAENGVDIEEFKARFELGGTENQGTRQAWIDRDMDTLLKAAGTSLENVSEDAYKAHGAVLLDATWAVADRMQQEMGSVLDDVFGRSEGLQAEQGAGSQLEPNQAGAEIADIAAQLQDKSDLSASEEDQMQERLAYLIEKELGEGGIAKLHRGDVSELEAVTGNKIAAFDAADEYLSNLSEKQSDFELGAAAADVRGEKKAELRKSNEVDLGDEDDLGL